jgi:hypothetical protein
MNPITKIAWLALFMNAFHGLSQERVLYKTVFYREAGPTSGPVILVLTEFHCRPGNLLRRDDDAKLLSSNSP